MMTCEWNFFSPTLYKENPKYIAWTPQGRGEEEGDQRTPGRVIWSKIRNVDGGILIKLEAAQDRAGWIGLD